MGTEVGAPGDEALHGQSDERQSPPLSLVGSIRYPRPLPSQKSQDHVDRPKDLAAPESVGSCGFRHLMKSDPARRVGDRRHCQTGPCMTASCRPESHHADGRIAQQPPERHGDHVSHGAVHGAQHDEGDAGRARKGSCGARTSLHPLIVEVDPSRTKLSFGHFRRHPTRTIWSSGCALCTMTGFLTHASHLALTKANIAQDR